MSIQQSLSFLANHFVDEIVDAIRRASLADIAGADAPARVKQPARAARVVRRSAPRATVKTARPSKPGRLARRSPEQIADQVNTVATLLRNHPAGLRSEQIRTTLGLEVRELPRLLKQGVVDHAFQILSGHKRSTVYGVRASRVVKPAKKAPRKAAKPVSKKKAAKKTAKKK